MTLPPITQKQQELLLYIPRFRFLDRTHIQKLLQHKDKHRINSWLKDLTEKQYITRLYDNKIIGKNRIPAVYYLYTNGVRYLRDVDRYEDTLVHKLYYEKDRSDTFISQSLLIASICCGLESKNSEVVKYEYLTETDFSQPDNPFHFLKVTNLPVDLYFSKKQKGGKKQHYLLSVFSQSLPRYRIRKRIRDYIDFYTNHIWEDYSNSPFPMILFVCETKAQLISTKRYTRALLRENDEVDIPIHFTTEEDVRKYGVTGEIWEKVG